MGFSWTENFELVTKTVNNTNPQSYVDLYNLMPPTRYTSNPIITHDAVFTNYCPAGWIVDPGNSSNFIMYIGMFKGNVDVGSQIGYVTGTRANPYSVSTITDCIVPSTSTTDPDYNAARFGSVYVDGGTVYYFYVGVDNVGLYQICAASSTDGKTFTKHGVILTPDGVNEAGFTDPSVIKDGSTWYMYVTRRDVGTQAPTAVVIASSTAPLSGWSKTGVTAVSLGSANSVDGKYIEGGQLLKLGNDYVLVYNGCTVSNIWSCCIAHSDTINSAMNKEANNPFFQHNGAATGSDISGVAVPFIVNNTGTQWVMYYQGSNQTQPASIWDVCIADFTSTVEVNPAGFVVPRSGWTGDTGFYDIEGTVVIGGSRSCRGLDTTGNPNTSISHAISILANTNGVIQVSMRAASTTTPFLGGFYVMEGSTQITGVYFDNNNISHLVGGNIEHLDTYTSVNPGSYFTITQNKVLATAMLSNATSNYLYKDFGANYFSGDFTHYFDFLVSNSAAQAYAALWSLQSNIGSPSAANGNQIFAQVGVNGTSVSFWAIENYGGTQYASTVLALSANVHYWAKATRTGTTFSISVYSNSARSTLVGTKTLTLHSAVAHQYMNAISQLNAGLGNGITVYNEDISINGVPTGAAWTALQTFSANTNYAIEVDLVDASHHSIKIDGTTASSNALNYNAVSSKCTDLKIEKATASTSGVYFDDISVSGDSSISFRRGFGARTGSRE